MFFDWFRQIALFVFAVFSHWGTLLTGGVVMGIVQIIERKGKNHISWKSYLAIVGVFFLYSIFAAWQDEHRNTAQVISDKAVLTSLHGECQTSLTVAKGALRDKESLVDTLQKAFISAQGPQQQQAATVASCVTSLAKMNPIIQRHIRAIAMPVTGHAWFAKEKSQLFEIVIMTNQQVAPRGTLKCSEPIALTGMPWLIPRDAMFDILTAPPDFSMAKEHNIQVDISGAIWTSENPIFVPAVGNTESMECTFELSDR